MCYFKNKPNFLLQFRLDDGNKYALEMSPGQNFHVDAR